MGRIRLEVADGVVTLTLADAAGRNALDEELIAELHTRAREADAVPEAPVVLLRAEGPAFSVGGSIPMFVEAGEGSHALLHRLGEHLNPAVRTLHESAKVVVAAVHGAVAGGGLGVMAAADLILAADDTVFALGYGLLGTTPDAGVSWFLTRDLGYRRALELYLTNERIDAARARELGLVNQVVARDELDSAAARLAVRLAAGPPGALTAAKRLFRQAAGLTLAQQAADEIRTFADNTLTPEFHEGVRAFSERRPPTWVRS